MSKDYSKLGQVSVTEVGGKRDQEQKEYADNLSHALGYVPGPKKLPQPPPGMTRDEWIESMQPQSTKAMIARQKDPNYSPDLSRPLPDNVLAVPDAKNQDELTNNRKELGKLDHDQVSHVEAIRRRPKNSLGQSTKDGADKETKVRAGHAFEFSPPAKVTKQEEERITKLKPSPAVTVPDQIKETWVPMTFWQAAKHWLQGGKVEKRENERQSYGAWLDSQLPKKDEDNEDNE